jgi:hypothetical protein
MEEGACPAQRPWPSLLCGLVGTPSVVAIPNNIKQFGRRPAKKMPGRVAERYRQREKAMVNINQTARERKLVSIRRTDPVVCPACGRRVIRRARAQRFCSTKCRMRSHRAEQVRNGGLNKNGAPIGDIRRVTPPPKNISKLKLLQRAESQSTRRIFGPRYIIEAECFAPHSWTPRISSEGVMVETASLRPRLVVSP